MFNKLGIAVAVILIVSYFAQWAKKEAEPPPLSFLVTLEGYARQAEEVALTCASSSERRRRLEVMNVLAKEEVAHVMRNNLGTKAQKMVAVFYREKIRSLYELSVKEVERD